MECVLTTSSSAVLPRNFLINCHHHSQKNSYGYSLFRMERLGKQPNAAVCCLKQAVSSSVGDVHKQRSSLQSLFCYDKAVPEEIIEKPIGISLAEKNIGNNPRCTDCQAKGAVLCTTCTGSGLYIDSILESQGIIVKVRCLGCGGTGNIMCSECGGRGHL
ncbi:uncharacterized protein LOC113775089 isoform X1 [Coffea eugenioides]|uniref:Uncharacterized protein isoform X1 n=1 Tax=Coffea arabica TaxID=13443 RepID=A0A6P6SV81_COFAR|nr:uncharacterized protein LOC113694955 isoform X1 [Coffea arabica]XP_027175628.1 uncharacterized protein LOC113775089 isoform X1 [Coffea eugenioides]